MTPEARTNLSPTDPKDVVSVKEIRCTRNAASLSSLSGKGRAGASTTTSLPTLWWQWEGQAAR